MDEGKEKKNAEDFSSILTELTSLWALWMWLLGGWIIEKVWENNLTYKKLKLIKSLKIYE